MSGVYEDLNNKFNIKTRVFYNESVDKVIDLKTLYLFLNDIYENCYKYMGNPFDGLKLDIYDDLYPEIPKNVTVCDPKTKKCITSYGVGNYSGLTWVSSNDIDLNDNLFSNPETKRPEFMSNLLSHEIGHLVAGRIWKFDQDSIPKTFWNNIRGIHEEPNTTKTEMVAEDFRRTLGSRLARGLSRGSYPQANTVKGLEDLYRIWAILTKTVSNYEVFCETSNYKWDFTKDGRLAFIFHIDYDNFFWNFLNAWIKIQADGIYKYNSKNQWELVQAI